MPDFIKSDGKLFLNKSLLPESSAGILEIVIDGNAGLGMLLLVHYQFKKVRFIDRTIWLEYIGWKGEKGSDEEVINAVLRHNNKDVGIVYHLEKIQIATVGEDKCHLDLPYEQYFEHGIDPQNVIRGLKTKGEKNV